MFSRIFHRMDAVKQVNSWVEVAIGLASVSLKREIENAELSYSIESRDKILERVLEQVGRNDPFHIVSEGPKEITGLVGKEMLNINVLFNVLIKH